MRFIKSVFTALFFLSISCPIISQEGWTNLLGKNKTNNFHQLNGEADFKIKGKKLIGISKLNTPNSFLATKKNYSDFILEFEVKIDTGLNSGVQIRSESNPEYMDGRVHGYQVEIETSPRKWAGGIYEEARRGWLYPLTDNPKGQEAWINGKWNRYRIEAIGHEIKTWVNGIPCANLLDDMTAEGFIAFQVHSIGKKEQEGKKVIWRNIKIKTEGLENEIKNDSNNAPVINLIEKNKN
ncbi:MAG: DUF1080 domain-containing protein [Saprospiraceae bacterium]